MTSVLLRLIVSACLIAAVIWATDGAAIVARLSGLSPVWMAVAIAALTLATVSMARRWQVVAAHLRLPLDFRFALREYYLGTAINQVLPGGVTGDAARAVRARHGADLKTAALSVALERLLGQVALFGLLAVGLLVALALPGGIDWGVLAWAVPAALAGLAAVGVFLARRRGAPGRLMGLLLVLQQRAELLVLAAISCGCLILSFYAAARATGAVLPATAWATLIPLVLVAMLIPLSIGGWGWREGAAAALFPLIGETASAGVAAGIAYGAAIWIAALPAAFILITNARTKPLSTPERQG